MLCGVVLCLTCALAVRSDRLSCRAKFLTKEGCVEMCVASPTDLPTLARLARGRKYCGAMGVRNSSATEAEYTREVAKRNLCSGSTLSVWSCYLLFTHSSIECGATPAPQRQNTPEMLQTGTSASAVTLSVWSCFLLFTRSSKGCGETPAPRRQNTTERLQNKTSAVAVHSVSRVWSCCLLFTDTMGSSSAVSVQLLILLLACYRHHGQ